MDSAFCDTMINKIMKCLLVIVSCLLTTNLVFASEKININTAPLKDLTKIIHIGESRAQELISLRPFYSLDELGKIKGIGEARLNDIKKQGLAWISGDSPSNLTESSPNLTRLSSTPDIRDEQPPINSGNSLLLPAAIFTSFAGGAIILILKRKTHVRT